jgi:superfamily I DNA/RNA helicase
MPNKEVIQVHERDESLDYLKILKAIKEIPFSVGKNLLIDFLKGNSKNSSIKNNLLHHLPDFGAMDYDEEKLKNMIDNLINNGLIEVTGNDSNKFMKLLKLTPGGREEIFAPKLYSKQLKNNFNHKTTMITEEDLIKFKELESFLSNYNDNQKKAIISEKEKILCIAGAGSGKTSVLTKRIEFSVRYRGINPEKILAITFTRKARQEMMDRLSKLNINVKVETFNSFCEKILLKYGFKIYGRQMNVISYGNKIMAMASALSSLGLSMNSAIDKYFSQQQKRNRTYEELSNIFMNDCFFILDYFKSKNKELYDFSKDAEPKHIQAARMIYNICRHLKQQMHIQGLRDYTDQILDAIRFFENNKDFIPEFEHILIDEYQDVNAMQIKLIDLLAPKNLFAVGDPRQSIFGWRGSSINYILNFEEKYPDSEIITLTKNYRSNANIVNLINLSIKDMGLPNLEATYSEEEHIQIYDFENEIKEFNFIINEILNSNIERDEIFVLARTNSQLKELSELLKSKNIRHIVKTDEIIRSVSAKKDEITLATIHSIKGLEAKMVFVIGCNEINFPCKASDHPVIEMIKLEDYDKEEEERRLFYVALSRAKQKLYLTYTGKKPTYFINNEMMKAVKK